MAFRKRFSRVFQSPVSFVRETGRGLADNPEKLLLGPVGIVSASASGLQKAGEKEGNLAAEEAQRQAATSSATAAEAERNKALAEESVRKQEEAARRRTIFGGEAIGQLQERKTLLGL